MKEILKIIYIAVCLVACLYHLYRWGDDAVDEIRGSYRGSASDSDRSKNKIVRIVLSIRDLWKVMSIFEYGHEYFLPTILFIIFCKAVLLLTFITLGCCLFLF